MSIKLHQLPSITAVDDYLKQQHLPYGQAVRPIVTQQLGYLRELIRQYSPEQAQPLGSIAGLRLTSVQDALEHIAIAVTQTQPNSFRRVVNATGVVIHTNLGRAPLSEQALANIIPLMSGYLDLELDLYSGKRSTRAQHLLDKLARLAGSAQALVVNNNAAAVLLLMQVRAQGKEVIVSRGELVEIGGGFRIPEIMRLSGVRLIEVGTTNRTRIADYAEAINPNTQAILKVHRSNFVQRGFVEETGLAELNQLCQKRSVQLWYDWGSAGFYRFKQSSLRDVPVIADEINLAQVIMCSADKIMGSIQAGLIFGAELDDLKKHPLYRTVRPDKLRLALLDSYTTQAIQNPQSLPLEHPVLECIERDLPTLRNLAEKLLQALASLRENGYKLCIEEDTALAGGGALPEHELPTFGVSLAHDSLSETSIAQYLREPQQHQPILCRIKSKKIIFDCRTLFEADIATIANAMQRFAEQHR